MSLYDGISVETAPLSAVIGSNNSNNDSKDQNSGLSGWSTSTSGMKMMATQVRRAKKVAAKSGPQRTRANQMSNVVLGGSKRPAQKTQSPALSGGSSLSTVPSILDETMDDDIGVSLEDEYDPFVPNDYEALTKGRKDKEADKRGEEWKKSSSERKTLSAFSSYSDSESDDEDEQWKEEKRRESAAMFAPPPTLIESSQSTQEGSKEEAPPFAVPRPPKFASAVASNIMAKYGWKAGQGLGKTEQGLKTALSVEKTSLRGGKIVNKDSVELMPPPPLPTASEGPPRNKGPSIPAVTTRVVLLKNMVGPGEVDEDLQPEVQEECGKYGQVSKCLIFEIPQGVPDEEAVRIFVEFTNSSSATKAYLDLNGRFFGGRVVSAEFYDEDRFAKFDLGP